MLKYLGRQYSVWHTHMDHNFIFPCTDQTHRWYSSSDLQFEFSLKVKERLPQVYRPVSEVFCY